MLPTLGQSGVVCVRACMNGKRVKYLGHCLVGRDSSTDLGFLVLSANVVLNCENCEF